MNAPSPLRKIAVINFSGNVGKSTLARHLLAPRLPHAALVAVESINADAASPQTVRGAAFGQLQEDMLLEESAIVDVGSSNVEQFLDLMRQYRGSHEDFDLYVVPCVPAVKQQRDTIACIRALAALGIAPSKIRVVFNLVPSDSPVETVFAPLFAFAAHERLCLLDGAAAVEASELFGRLRDLGLSIQEVLDDATDYKQAIAQAGTSEEKIALAARLSVRRLAAGMSDGLERAFQALIAMDGVPEHARA